MILFLQTMRATFLYERSFHESWVEIAFCLVTFNMDAISLKSLHGNNSNNYSNDNNMKIDAFIFGGKINECCDADARMHHVSREEYALLA